MDCKLKIQDPSAMGAAEDVTTDVLSRSPNRPNFGNTGELENLRIAKNYVPEEDVTSYVPCSIPGILFKPQDLNPEYERNINAALSLKGLFKGAFDAKKSPRNSKSSHVSEERGRDPRDLIPANSVFKEQLGAFSNSAPPRIES